MKLLLSALATALFLTTTPALADLKADCEQKAVSKDGKPLAGAARQASMKKCMQGDAPAAMKPSPECEKKAVSKDGKPLAGAARNASIKKCMKGA